MLRCARGEEEQCGEEEEEQRGEEEQGGEEQQLYDDNDAPEFEQGGQID